jgi:ubiquinone/menaquinone biosynthesis C-methylase UbiE
MSIKVTPSIRAASQDYWRHKIDAVHRHSDEDWFRLYAQELLAMMPLGGTLFDVGCGACQLTTYLADAFDRIVAIDLSDSMLSAARNRVASLKLSQIVLMKGDATQLPVPDRSADVILAYGVIQYLDEAGVQKHLAECERVLKPGGLICWGLTPNARMRRLWYAGALSNPRPSLIQMCRRSMHAHYAWARAIKGGNPLWDGVGNWFDQTLLYARCDRAGFVAEFRNCWYYEYRFHVLLRRKEAIAT